MIKKILFIGGAMVLVGIIVTLAVPWGTYESNIEKSEIIEAIEYSGVSKEDEEPPSLDGLEGIYSIRADDGVVAEILFTTKGLKSTQGGFEQFEIRFEISDDYTESKLMVDIETASLNTGNGLRDEHLLEEDFFDALEFPSILFEAESIELGDTSYVAKGELTLNGTKKSLDVPFLHLGAGDNENQHFEAFQGYFEFDRVKYGQEESSGVGNVVKVNFYCELNQDN